MAATPSNIDKIIAVLRDKDASARAAERAAAAKQAADAAAAAEAQRQADVAAGRKPGSAQGLKTLRDKQMAELGI